MSLGFLSPEQGPTSILHADPLVPGEDLPNPSWYESLRGVLLILPEADSEESAGDSPQQASLWQLVLRDT